MTRRTHLMYTLSALVGGFVIVAGGAIYYYYSHRTTGTTKAVTAAVASLHHKAAPSRAPSSITKQSDSQPSSTAASNNPATVKTSSSSVPRPSLVRGTVKQVTDDGLVVQTATADVIPVWVDDKTRFTDKGNKISLQQITVGSTVTLACNSINNRLLALIVQAY